MRKFLKEYFSFSRSELRIIVIIGVLIVVSYFLRFLIPVPKFNKLKLTAEDNAVIDSFIQSLEKIEYESKAKSEPWFEPEKLPVFKNFNPNEITLPELDEMGFPGYIGKNLIRYRQAGGKFRNSEDFKKLYGMTDLIFNKWEGYLIIPEIVETDTFRTYVNSKPIIELNHADSAELLTISGIGPYFAGKIVSYRDRLGGYRDTDQLLEVKGMDNERIESMLSQIIVDTTFLVKINLNTASLQGLKRHPYITARMAESILKYRQFAEYIRDVEELSENHILKGEEYLKLKPYLTTGE